MALNPVGPLPASTYWRRRAVLLIGLVLVLLVLKSCASGGDSPKKKTSTTPRPTPSVSRSATPVTTKPPAAAGGLCADAALTVTATTDADTYGLGATPKITLSVKNSGATACRRDLGAGAIELLVFSGEDRIWSSDDCSPSKAVSVVTLPPGGSQAVVKTWSGKRSKPGCTGTEAAASVGTYKVVSRVGTLRQDGQVFRLHA
ncbi:MAG: hypothetical protein JWO12_2097 [Frankiales bacterium]|nr:hypothetical protein [Frankiales bacterium]